MHLHLCNDVVCVFLKGESVDLKQSLSTLQTTAPCIVAFGLTRCSLSDVKVVIEKTNLLQMPSVSTAIHFCFASYYVFNISFPSDFKFILLFLEKYVYGLKSSQKLPMSVALVHDGMERLHD